MITSFKTRRREHAARAPHRRARERPVPVVNHRRRPALSLVSFGLPRHVGLPALHVVGAPAATAAIRRRPGQRRLGVGAIQRRRVVVVAVSLV